MVPNLSVLLQSNRGLTGLKSDGSTSYANYIIHFNSNSMAENVMTFGKTFFFCSLPGNQHRRYFGL